VEVNGAVTVAIQRQLARQARLLCGEVSLLSVELIQLGDAKLQSL
jgi:hypothetical protein